MNIGELARQAGVPIDTVRYYERNGLLPEPARRASGYRNYQQADVDRLQFVRRAKELGFHLTEIRGLLAIADRYGDASEEVRHQAREQLADVERKLEELGRLRSALTAIAQPTAGQAETGRCPLLHVLRDKSG